MTFGRQVRPGCARHRWRCFSGFSLIELLVVIAIILVIAAIAIPNLMQARMRANEASAVASLRSITTAQISYLSVFQQGYAPSLPNLGPPAGGGAPTPAGADQIDPVLAGGSKSGYTFLYTATDLDGDGKMDVFTVNGNPIHPGVTGQKFFFVDQTNIIRYNIGAAAGPASQPIPQ